MLENIKYILKLKRYIGFLLESFTGENARSVENRNIYKGEKKRK